MMGGPREKIEKRVRLKQTDKKRKCEGRDLTLSTKLRSREIRKGETHHPALCKNGGKNHGKKGRTRHREEGAPIRHIKFTLMSQTGTRRDKKDKGGEVRGGRAKTGA